MDSLTQAALGAVIGHSILAKPLGRAALGVGAVLGTLPDLDVLIPYGNDVDNFIYHRGFSHSLFVLIAVSPFIALMLYRGMTYLRPHLVNHVSFVRVLIAVALALTTHPLLDAFTAYGTQIFWPIGAPWHGPPPVSWSSIFIIDPFYTLPLIVAVVAALYRPTQTRVAIAALGVSSLYLIWSLAAKHIVDSKLNDQLPLPKGSYQLFSTPTPFNTLLYRFIVTTEDRYLTGHVSVRRALLQADYEIDFVSQPRNVDLVKQLDSSQMLTFEKLAWFSQGFYQLEDAKDGIVFTDLRMGEEENYVFRFVIADPDGTEGIQLPYQLKTDYSLDGLGEIYKKL